MGTLLGLCCEEMLRPLLWAVWLGFVASAFGVVLTFLQNKDSLIPLRRNREAREKNALQKIG